MFSPTEKFVLIWFFCSELLLREPSNSWCFRFGRFGSDSLVPGNAHFLVSELGVLWSLAGYPRGATEEVPARGRLRPSEPRPELRLHCNPLAGPPRSTPSLGLT